MSTASTCGLLGPGGRVLVLGAGGQLGRAVVARLVEDGYRVRTFQRRAPEVDWNPMVEVVLGTALDRDAVARAAADQDALVNVIGSGTLRRNTVESDTTAAALDVLQRTGPRRYIGISSGLVAGVSFVFDRVIRPLVLEHRYREHLAVEQLIRQSNLEWTVVRPTRLDNRPPRGYQVATEHLPNFRTTSRADVAAFISQEVRTCRYLRQAVFLVSR